MYIMSSTSLNAPFLAPGASSGQPGQVQFVAVDVVTQCGPAGSGALDVRRTWLGEQRPAALHEADRYAKWLPVGRAAGCRATPHPRTVATDTHACQEIARLSPRFTLETPPERRRQGSARAPHTYC